MRNFLLESNEIRFRPKKTTFDIFENSYGNYDVIMIWNYDKMINIEQNIALASRLGLITAKISYFAL